MTNQNRSPDWLSLALSRKNEPVCLSPCEPEWPIAPEIGDIRAAIAGAPHATWSRLVLVLGLDFRIGVVTAALVDGEVSAGTDMDVRLEPDETHLSFPFVVETDVVAPLRFVQLGPRLSKLSKELTTALSNLPSVISEVGPSDGQTLSNLISDHKRGLPTREPSDPLWRWKKSEADSMRRLATECLESMFEEAEPVSIPDPAILLSAALASDSWSKIDRALLLSEWWEQNQQAVPAAALRPFLDSEDILDVELWRGTPLGLDAWNAWEGLRHRILQEDGSDRDMVVPVTWHPSRRHASGSDLLARAIAASGMMRTVHLATLPDFWNSKVQPGAFALDLGDDRRIQIIPELLGDNPAEARDE